MRIPFRTAMPNRVMKPTSVAMLSTPPVSSTAKTPAHERQRQVHHHEQRLARGAELHEEEQEDGGQREEREQGDGRVASSADSNWPPYST
jgi:hypothetical protein